MVKKIVFFCMGPLHSLHSIVSGEEVLVANGFQVWFYDFSALVFPALHKKKTNLEQFKNKNYLQFHNYKKALQAIQELDEEYLVVIVGYYQAETFKIFRALSQSKILYAIMANSTTPFGMGQQGKSWWWKLFSIFYRFKLKKLRNIFYKPFLAPLLNIRSPDMCILGGEKSLSFNRSIALIGKNTKLLWTHAHDYDDFLKHSTKKYIQENTAVFIDLGVPKFAWDQFLPRGLTHLTVDKYYPSLCSFFDYVEKKLDLKVIIAAHPKSNHVKNAEYFGKREILKGQTHELIKKSKLVISHASTALNSVVVEKKPVLFLTTAEYKADLEYSKRMKLMASSLGKSLINIDDRPYSLDWEKEMMVDHDLYLNYERNYIKKEHSEQLNTWEIFSKKLKQLGW